MTRPDLPQRLQTLGFLALTSCGSPEPELEYVDVGVDVRLNAVGDDGTVAYYCDCEPVD